MVYNTRDFINNRMKRNFFSRRKFNPDVVLEVINNKKCIIVTYEGCLNVEDAEKAVGRTIKLLDENAGEKLVLVWNCLEITDYEPNCRKILQKAATDYKDSLEVVYTIVTSPLIIAATEIISFFSPVKIKTVNSYNKLVESI